MLRELALCYLRFDHNPLTEIPGIFKAFPLIELLIVIAIIVIGILASIAIPMYKAQDDLSNISSFNPQIDWNTAGTVGSDSAITWAWDYLSSTLDPAYMPRQ